MPKKGKGKGDTAVAPLPPIDQAYVQALKIQHLEDRNEALRGELQTLRHERELLKSDETDVHEHMQRDIRSKGVRIGELQRELQETRAQLEEAVSSKEQELAKQREEIEAERHRTATEMQRTSNELHEVKAFQERQAIGGADFDSAGGKGSTGCGRGGGGSGGGGSGGGGAVALRLRAAARWLAPTAQ